VATPKDALIDGAPGRLRPAARLRDPGSGLFLDLHTTQPSLQVYTANDFDAVPGKRGARYGRHAGVALEAQAPPDAVHHPHFGDVVLRPGQEYRQRTEFRFGGW
jgi:aldose 1-epimerase